MSRRMRITALVVAIVLTVSTPFFWLLDNPDTGQLVAASVQGATGIAALVWALMQSQVDPQPAVAAIDTGKANATGGAGVHRRAALAGGRERARSGGTNRRCRSGRARQQRKYGCRLQLTRPRRQKQAGGPPSDGEMAHTPP